MRCWWARACVKKKMMEGRGGRDNMDSKMKNIEYSSGGILYVGGACVYKTTRH